jgi:hypothetical protein
MISVSVPAADAIPFQMGADGIRDRLVLIRIADKYVVRHRPVPFLLFMSRLAAGRLFLSYSDACIVTFLALIVQFSVTKMLGFDLFYQLNYLQTRAYPL